MAPLRLRKTVYIGTFIHCTSQTQFDVVDAAIGVDEHGVIAFVNATGVKDDILGSIKSQEGWSDFDVVQPKEETCQFFFPGFVGESSYYLSRSILVPSVVLSVLRLPNIHTQTRTSTPVNFPTQASSASRPSSTGWKRTPSPWSPP